MAAVFAKTDETCCATVASIAGEQSGAYVLITVPSEDSTSCNGFGSQRVPLLAKVPYALAIDRGVTGAVPMILEGYVAIVSPVVASFTPMAAARSKIWQKSTFEAMFAKAWFTDWLVA